MARDAVRNVRVRRKPARTRLARTILLGTAAVAASIAWLARELALDREELLSFLGLSAAFVAIFVVLAVLVGALLALVRRGARKRD